MQQICMTLIFQKQISEDIKTLEKYCASCAVQLTKYGIVELDFGP